MVLGADADIATIVTIIVTVTSSSFMLVWKASKEFGAIRQFVEERFDKLLEKLEYHERHDDQRFGEIRDHIWELRLALKTDKLDKLIIRNEEQLSGK